ncbi:AAA family ATPase [Amycolatopsis sp. NPDC051045]|uniref:helix-turn-helix transcriptional regulator n=1 Tax=Amycolatopsis sp. NPDC051045 TaxID=3156922 RepID=UPI003427C761
MRESRLVGRERAVSVLGDLVAGLADGRAATAAISGAAGTGRTALLEWVLAAAPGAPASCVPDGIPFGAVTQLAGALLPPSAYADLVTACLDDRERAAGRLCDAFASLAAEGPLVLAVDDLQWADEWSRWWFEEMAARTGDAPVLLLATSHEPLAVGHGIALSPLTTAETTTLAHRVLGELPREVLAAALDVVRGRPAVLEELAERWKAGSEAGAAEPWSAALDLARDRPVGLAPHRDPAAPARFAGLAAHRDPAQFAPAAGLASHWNPARVAAAGRAVTSARAARVRRGLPPDALALLRAMAVSERLDVVAAVGLAGLSSAAAPKALSALEASGLVTDGRLAEPHLAADALAELAESERDELYRRGAELAHRTGAGALVAAELLRAAPPVGEPWARTVLVEAAEQWSAQGNPVAAAEALRRALAEPARPADRAVLLIRLASAVVRREPDHADRRLVQVLTEPDLAEHPAAATAADLLLARGDAETVHRLVAELGSPEPGRSSTVDPALVALGVLAREEAAVDPEMPVPALPGPDVLDTEAPAGEARPSTPGGESAASPARTPAHPGHATSSLHRPPPTVPRDPAAAGVAAFRLAVRGEQRTTVLALADRALVVREEAPLMPRLAACRALLCAGVAGAAVDALTAVVAAARRRDARAAAARALVLRADVALRGDRPDDALRDLAAADRELPARCWHPAALPARSAVEIAVHLRLGRLEHARNLAAEPRPRGGGHSAAAAFLLHAEAELALAGADPGTALSAALECGRVLRSRGWVNPMLTPWRTTASLALRRLGHREAAATLAAEELSLAERWGTAAALEALRDRVAAGHRAVPAPRRPADPPPALRFPPARPDALSPAEREVAELAARGLANREIARELSIALRTVELRLTKVYRKLGLQGRGALADHWPTRTPGG